MTPSDIDILLTMLRDMEERQVAAITDVKEAALETKRELSGQIGRVQHSVDGASERINHQNGRIAKLEGARREDIAAQREREKIHEARWRRIRTWGKVTAGCFIAIVGSASLVLIEHFIRT